MKKGMKVKVPVQDAWVGRAASLPPPPCSVGGAVRGGGEGWQAGSSQGILSREGGISGKQAASWNGRFFWRVNSAGYSRGWIQQVSMARYFGGSFWRVILAGHFGAFIWRVFMANEASGFQRKVKQRKERKCIISRSVNCIMSIVCSQ